MSTYLFILGKHPSLSIAELQGRYSNTEIISTGDDYALMKIDTQIDQKEFNNLGGSLKAAKVIRETDKEKLIPSLSEALATHYKDSKLDYGLSLYGVPEKQLRTILLDLKKELKKNDIKSRFINHEFKNISSAQYKSIREKGIELIILRDKGSLFVCETVGVQDIDFYSKRDYDKPFRDMKMGMLPPKLAQILINLTGVSGKIWDPFCGSGTLVMEGLLMGRDMMGSDIKPEHVEGAEKNVGWLKNEFNISNEAELFVHDATYPLRANFSAIVFEGDLGIPHTQLIQTDRIKTIIHYLDDLYTRFFANLKYMQCKTPIVCALPFFRLKDGKELDLGKTIEAIEEMGFKKTKLVSDFINNSDNFTLKYSREDQAVGRAIYRFIL
jgi:tRNA G10  N-methylase Trm11